MDNNFLQAYRKARQQPQEPPASAPAQPQVPPVKQPTPTANSDQAPDTPLQKAIPDAAPSTPSFLQNDTQKPGDTKEVSKMAKKEPPVTTLFKSTVFLAFMALAGLALVAVLGFSLYKRSTLINSGQAIKGATDQGEISTQNQRQAQNYVEEIRKIIALPEDEEAISVAAITEESKVKQQQAFFRNAKNGDILVVFPSRAVLYDPKSKMIIEVAPVNLQKENPPAATATATPTD